MKWPEPEAQYSHASNADVKFFSPQFYDAFTSQNIQRRMLGWLMNDKFERISEGAVLVQLRFPWFSSAPLDKRRDSNYVDQTMIASFQIFPVNQSSYYPSLYNLYTYSVVK
jgi:hypothetical protein